VTGEAHIATEAATARHNPGTGPNRRRKRNLLRRGFGGPDRLETRPPSSPIADRQPGPHRWGGDGELKEPDRWLPSGVWPGQRLRAAKAVAIMWVHLRRPPARCRPGFAGRAPPVRERVRATSPLSRSTARWSPTPPTDRPSDRASWMVLAGSSRASRSWAREAPTRRARPDPAASGGSQKAAPPARARDRCRAAARSGI